MRITDSLTAPLPCSSSFVSSSDGAIFDDQTSLFFSGPGSIPTRWLGVVHDLSKITETCVDELLDQVTTRQEPEIERWCKNY
jgi:hypothetical protein